MGHPIFGFFRWPENIVSGGCSASRPGLKEVVYGLIKNTPQRTKPGANCAAGAPGLSLAAVTDSPTEKAALLVQPALPPLPRPFLPPFKARRKSTRGRSGGAGFGAGGGHLEPEGGRGRSWSRRRVAVAGRRGLRRNRRGRAGAGERSRSRSRSWGGESRRRWSPPRGPAAKRRGRQSIPGVAVVGRGALSSRSRTAPQPCP